MAGMVFFLFIAALIAVLLMYPARRIESISPRLAAAMIPVRAREAWIAATLGSRVLGRAVRRVRSTAEPASSALAFADFGKPHPLPLPGNRGGVKGMKKGSATAAHCDDSVPVVCTHPSSPTARMTLQRSQELALQGRGEKRAQSLKGGVKGMKKGSVTAALMNDWTRLLHPFPPWRAYSPSTLRERNLSLPFCS